MRRRERGEQATYAVAGDHTVSPVRIGWRLKKGRSHALLHLHHEMWRLQRYANLSFRMPRYFLHEGEWGM